LLRTRSLVATLGLSLALATSSLLGPPSAGADTAYERGPAPSWSSIQATTGPFAYTSVTVADSASTAFGPATIYYPTDTSQGTFGGIAISPGYTEKQSAISWWGPRLASQGFVVMTIDTNSIYDQPNTRATELLAALDYLTGSSTVTNRVDGTRTAVMGHSMGGGASLEASKTRPSLQAAVPLAPWDTNKTFSTNQTPTLIVGAQNDSVAPVSSHAIPFYNSLPSTLAKGYLELAGAAHSTTNSPNTTAAEYALSWLKRFVDNDLRYDQFLCPAPSTSSTISKYLSTCPYA
jgi:alpha-beta hydrolase superfamily lysophospholipase